MIRIPESDSLADLRLTAFDVMFRLGDRLVEFWNSKDTDLIERARLNRIDVAAERSQRSGWRHTDDPGYVLKEPGQYKSLLQLPPLGEETTKKLKGAMTSIGDQRDRWAHQTPELIDHPGPHGHLVNLTRDAKFVSETLGFDELVRPLDRLRSALDGGLTDVPLAQPVPRNRRRPRSGSVRPRKSLSGAGLLASWEAVSGAMTDARSYYPKEKIARMRISRAFGPGSSGYETPSCGSHPMAERSSSIAVNTG